MRRAVVLLFLGASACGAYTGSTSVGIPNVAPPPQREKAGPAVGVASPGVPPTPSPECEIQWDILGPEEIAQGLTRAWDRNHDGVLEPEELALGTTALPEPMRDRIAQLEAEARPTGIAAFRYWDKNGDGVIETDELTRSMVERWDANGDGVVEPDEWPVG